MLNVSTPLNKIIFSKRIVYGFGSLPLLSQKFWNIPKYNENNNKTYELFYEDKMKNINLCINGNFIHKFDKNKNNFISSNMNIIGELYGNEIKIEENCFFCNEIDTSSTYTNKQTNILKQTNKNYFNYIMNCYEISNENDTFVFNLTDKIDIYLKLNFENNNNDDIVDNFWLPLTKLTQNNLNLIKNIINENENNIVIS